MLLGIGFGLLQAATPLVFWWLDSATVYALALVLIAAAYVGFAVADGRPKAAAGPRATDGVGEGAGPGLLKYSSAAVSPRAPRGCASAAARGR